MPTLTPAQKQIRAHLLARLAHNQQGECPYCHRPFELGPDGAAEQLRRNLGAYNALIAALHPESAPEPEGQ